MRANLNPNQERILKVVIKETKEIPCFECGGLLFSGDRVTASIEFVYNNPTGGDFYVWLQDNYTTIGKI